MLPPDKSVGAQVHPGLQSKSAGNTGVAKDEWMQLSPHSESFLLSQPETLPAAGLPFTPSPALVGAPPAHPPFATLAHTRLTLVEDL